MKTLLVIVGPTGIGKTELAIQLAKEKNAQIISADARQFYREMEIGTAKPTESQLAEVPHHFVNNLSIHTKNYTAGKYEHQVIEFLENYYKTNDTAILVGGSGLFVRAVCEGFDPIEKRDDSELWKTRNFLNEKSLEWLQLEVERLDPEFYEKVDKKNPVRLKRALEVIYNTGKKYSEQRIGKKHERFFTSVKIGLQMDRELLYNRINLRVDHMMDAGLLEEAQSLFMYHKFPALNTVGYTELFDYILGNCSLETAISLIKQNTRNYAKRQMTWFKKEEDITWFEATAWDKISAHLASIY